MCIQPLQILSTSNLEVYDDPYGDFPNQNSDHSNNSEHFGQSNHSEHSDQSNQSDFDAVEIVTNPYNEAEH